MLKICPMCERQFEGQQLFCPEDGSTLRPMNPTANLVGHVVADRYKVVRLLGEGGMGQVYLATHVRIGRPSALKVMNPKLVDSADAVSRFVREATNASKIEHANIAGIHDFGETKDGLVYLAMEYVDGDTLGHMLKRDGPMSPRRVAPILRDVAAALRAAHAKGIVHRDLKPDNIMVADRDEGLLVKVVDFGLAKAMGQEGQSVTTTGMVVGTPAFMSPEQVTGEEVGPASDQFSLALVAFNLMTDELPFPSATTYETMLSRLSEPPKPIREFRQDLDYPDGLDDVLRKALDPKAAQRYPDVTAFAEAFARAARVATEYAARPSADTIVGDAPKVRVPPTQARAARPKGLAVVLPAAALLAVTGLGIVVIPKLRSVDPAPSITPYERPMPGGTMPDITPASGGTVAPPPATAINPASRPNDAPAPPSTSASSATRPGAGTRTEVPAPSNAARADGRDIGELEQLTANPDDEAANRRAAALAITALRRAASRNDSVSVLWLKSKAEAQLGEAQAACATLDRMAPLAGGTAFSSRVAQATRAMECEP